MSDLPQPLDDHEEMEMSPQQARNQRHRWWLIAALLSICVLIGVRRYILAQGYIGSGLFSQPSSTTSGQISLTPSPTPEPGMTVLLMGRGGVGHDGGALADTIVVARILETQKRIVLLSLPRDLWVNIPYKDTDGIMGKINSSYAIGIDSKNYAGKAEKYTGPLGGGMLTKVVVTQVTGLAVDKYVTVDFSGFEQAIDSIGGVELTVDKAFSDYEYPITGREDMDCAATATDSADISEAALIASGKLDINSLPELPKQYPCRYELLHFDTGKQTMNGKTALKYVRSRHSTEDGNDFSRSRRQKILLQSVADKLFSIGAITKIPSFFTTLRSHIDTDISNTDLVGMLPKAQSYRGYAITSLTLSTDNYLGQGYTPDGQFELFPLTGVTNYEPIKSWVAHAVDPKEALQYPLVEINGNWKNSSASATLKDTLNAAGYPTKAGQLIMKNATTSATLYIQSEHIDEKALAKIKEIAHVSDTYVVTKIATGSSDIKIIFP